MRYAFDDLLRWPPLYVFAATLDRRQAFIMSSRGDVVATAVPPMSSMSPKGVYSGSHGTALPHPCRSVTVTCAARSLTPTGCGHRCTDVYGGMSLQQKKCPELRQERYPGTGYSFDFKACTRQDGYSTCDGRYAVIKIPRDDGLLLLLRIIRPKIK